MKWQAGSWTIEGTVKANSMGPGGPITENEKCDWMENNFFLVCHVEFKSDSMGSGSGISVMNSFIRGMPSETHEQWIDTMNLIDWIMDTAPEARVSVYRFAPYPGGPAYDMAVKGDTFYGGSTNSGIVASEIYKKAIGVDAKRVNYRSAFDAMNEMANGSIDFYFTDATTAIGQIAGGKYKALAVTGATRTAAFPDVPTMTELGYPMDLSPWWGVIVPAGTPQAIKDKLAAWTTRQGADNE